MSDAQNLYNSAVEFIHNLQAIGDAFVGGHYEPESFNGVATEINDLTGDAQDLSFIGTRMINYLVSSSNASHYRPAYISGAAAWFRNMEGYIVQFQADITAYRALAQRDDDRALAIMNQMMYLERYANCFRDPYTMGYAPIIPSPGSIDSILAPVAGPVHGNPVVPDYE